MHNIQSISAFYLLGYLNQKNGTVGFPFNCSTFQVVFYLRYSLYTLKILINQIIHNCIAAAEQSSDSQPKLGLYAMQEVLKPP